MGRGCVESPDYKKIVGLMYGLEVGIQEVFVIEVQRKRIMDVCGL